MDFIYITYFLLVYLTKFIATKIDDEVDEAETCGYINYQDKSFNRSTTACPKNNICKKTFNISYVELPPFSTFAFPTKYPESPEHPPLKCIQELLDKCCGNCSSHTELNTFTNITGVTASSINTSDFIFPILGTPSTKRMYGYYYLPYFEIPDITYLVTKVTEGETLFGSILKLYPIIIVCLLLAALAGFVIWILETWTNKAEFSRPFLKGWFDGFWWSFISMTTVGYGDKTPKSFVSRVFAVVWILGGMIAFAILSGELTANIIKVNSQFKAEIKDKKVGALRYRDYDAMVILQHEGKVHWNNNSTNFMSDVLNLIKEMKNGTIDGILFDKYTLIYTKFKFNDLLYEKNETTWNRDLMSFFMKDTVNTEKRYSGGDKFTYGMLIKHYPDYRYFKDFARELGSIHNKVYIGNFLYEKTDVKSGDLSASTTNILFSPEKRFFQLTMISIGAMLGVIIAYGIFHEMRRINNIKSADVNI